LIIERSLCFNVAVVSYREIIETKRLRDERN